MDSVKIVDNKPVRVDCSVSPSHLCYAADVDMDGGWCWSIQLRIFERNNFFTLENVANCISLEMAL